MSKVYEATVERDGKFWLISIPEVGRVTQARNLGEAEAMACDLVGIMEGVDPESVVVALHIKLPEQVAAHLAEMQRQRELAASSNSRAAEEARKAAAALRADGLTVRDIGAALGVSHQRADQLLKPLDRPGRRIATPVRERAGSRRITTPVRGSSH